MSQERQGMLDFGTPFGADYSSSRFVSPRMLKYRKTMIAEKANSDQYKN